MPEHRLTVVQIHTNFRGHMDDTNWICPKWGWNQAVCSGQSGQSSICGASLTYPEQKCQCWCLFSSEGFLKRKLLHRATGCYCGASLGGWDWRQTGREYQFLSWRMDVLIYPALQQIFLCGTVWYMLWFIMNFASLQWWPICDRDWQLHLWHMPESSGQRWLHQNP